MRCISDYRPGDENDHRSPYYEEPDFDFSALDDVDMARLNRTLQAARKQYAQRPKVHRCCRCGSYKDAYRFREGQKCWAMKCDTCEATPVGVCASQF